MNGPVKVICIGHRTDIISAKDLRKDITWTYFRNWKHRKHKILQNSGGGTCLHSLLLFDLFIWFI